MRNHPGPHACALLLLANTVPLVAACYPTYAPPVRAAQYGAPARLREGDVELAGMLAGVTVPDVGGPEVGVGVTDWLALETGANLAFATARDDWATGYFGARLQYASDRARDHGWLLDVEIGGGAGAGGRCEGGCSPDGETDPLHWWQHAAFGGYQGLGFGGRYRLFSYYLRGRVEETAASNIPITYWPSAGGGVEFDIDHDGSVGFGGGYLGYHNAADDQNGWYYQVTGAIYFDAFRPSATAPEAD